PTGRRPSLRRGTRRSQWSDRSERPPRPASAHLEGPGPRRFVDRRVLMGAAPELVVASGGRQLADDVAARLVATLVSAQQVRPLAHLVVTAGGILEQVAQALRDSPARDSIDWSRVALWWGDERYVPADSNDRNDTAMLKAGLDALPLDPSNVHPMPASDGPYGED